MYFVLIYDRAAGRLLDISPESDRKVALRRRMELQLVHERSSDVEVMILSGESQEALRETHARYFDDPGSLLQRGIAAFPQSA